MNAQSACGSVEVDGQTRIHRSMENGTTWTLRFRVERSGQ